jgi:hypothetical protein
MMHILENWWFPTLVVAWCGLTMWRSTRHPTRPSALKSKIRPHATRELHPKAPFRRADFAAKAEIARKESAKGATIALAIIVAGGPLGVVITRLFPHLPRVFFIVFMTIYFAGVVGPYVLFTARGSLLARRSGLICPACGIELEGAAGVRNLAYLIENRVLETGKCPGCRAQLLDPSEVGPVPWTSTRAETARGVGLIAVLLAVLVVMVYFTHKQVTANAWSRCRRLYDRAYTAADSVAIDSTRLDRDDSVGCEYFRRTHDPEPSQRSFLRSLARDHTLL